jgi:hypothetical protein
LKLRDGLDNAVEILDVIAEQIDIVSGALR